MTRDRLGRIAKLLTLREHALERARAAYAVADREAKERSEAASAEEARYESSVERARSLREGSVDDFLLARSEVLSARQRVESRETALAAALEQLDGRKRAVTDAHRGVRQMELYAESTQAILREEERLLDRIASDEIAARSRKKDK